LGNRPGCLAIVAGHGIERPVLGAQCFNRYVAAGTKWARLDREVHAGGFRLFLETNLNAAAFIVNIQNAATFKIISAKVDVC
jgi:hypothetical protein